MAKHPTPTHAFVLGGKPMIKPSHKGLLHERLGVAPGKTIPRGRITADLSKAKARGNVKAEKQDVFALNFGKGRK